MKNYLFIVFYITLHTLGSCQDCSNNYFTKDIITINFDEVVNITNDTKIERDKMSLVIKNDSIQTFTRLLNGDTIEYPSYSVSFTYDSIFIQTAKNRVLFFSTVKNDTTKLIDIKSMNDEFPTFIGLSVYLKDSTINILGCNRECYIFKQMRGKNINNTYSTYQMVFIDKKKLILLKQESIFFDVIQNKELNVKTSLTISSMF